MKVCYKTSNGQEKWDTRCLYLYENTGVDHCLRSQGSDSKYLKINVWIMGNGCADHNASAEDTAEAT